ncbi:MAG TPA: hypothetical protein DDY14_16805, partial [Chromatiaceae bacterium]|nr:hypothetical protein [Chromatiaceae bacterium]
MLVRGHACWPRNGALWIGRASPAPHPSAEDDVDGIGAQDALRPEAKPLGIGRLNALADAVGSLGAELLLDLPEQQVRLPRAITDLLVLFHALLQALLDPSSLNGGQVWHLLALREGIDLAAEGRFRPGRQLDHPVNDGEQFRTRDETEQAECSRLRDVHEEATRVLAPDHDPRATGTDWSKSACKRRNQVRSSLLEHFSGLGVFVDHPAVPMDNNRGENSIR